MNERAAFFLDRDGTINQEVDYLSRIDQLELLPGTVEAFAKIHSAGFLIIVVTNQSGVARGRFSEAALSGIHDALLNQLQSHGVRWDDLYYCPHHPQAELEAYRRSCDCRKPEPGMLWQAAQQHQIDLTRSWMLGDTLRDVAAGHRAGCRAVLLKTGKGEAESRQLSAPGWSGDEPDLIAPDLLSAVDQIVESRD